MNCLLEFLLVQKLKYEKHELSAKRRHIYVFNFKNKPLNDLTKQINNINNIKTHKNTENYNFQDKKSKTERAEKVTNYI